MQFVFHVLHKYHYSMHSCDDGSEIERQFFQEKAVERSDSQKQAAREEKRLRMETKSAVTCLKCKLPTVTFNSVQIRRADEGMSMMYVCRSCGFNWTEK